MWWAGMLMGEYSLSIVKECTVQELEGLGSNAGYRFSAIPRP
jgi:hypothetical protein